MSVGGVSVGVGASVGVSHGLVSLVSMDSKLKDLIGGCCVCADESGWEENPLVYCDGPGCYVAVHQACYGIVAVPIGPWYCRRCESQERPAKVRCELCPYRHGALKRTDSNSWAHVVCALYIPEVRFGNVATMEPIVLGLVPADRYLKVCYLCDQQGQESRASSGACMQCNRSGCKQMFHVTCAQRAGFLCEEAGNYMDNVKYCGYCDYHFQRINKKCVKVVPKYKPPDLNLIRVLLNEEDKGPPGGWSPSRSPRDMSGQKEPQNLSLSSSSSSSRKGKKGQRSSQSAASSSTDSPKLETEKSSVGSPSSTSSSAAKRSHSEDDIVPTKSSKKDFAKNPMISTTSSADKTNDVSSTAEVSEKKPPSVIVKFGKQDGTYYSKKQELFPPSSIKKEKDRKAMDNIPNSTNKDSGSNSRSRSSSSSGSVEPSSDKSLEAQSNSKENSRGYTRMNLAETSLAPTSTGMYTIGQNSESPSTTAEVDKKTDIKTEPVEFDEDAALSTLKAPTGLPISAPERTMMTEIRGIEKISSNMSATISSSSLSNTSKQSVGSSSLSSSAMNKDATLKIPAVSPAGMTSKNEVKLPSMSPAASSIGAKRHLEGSSQSNSPFQYHTEDISRPISPSRINTELISPTADQKVAPASKRTASGKRLGRPPRKGTHMHSDSLGPMATMEKQLGDSVDARKRKQSPQSRLTNGSDTAWMMGATLNPSSSVAKEMDACLKDEIKTHAAYDPLSRNSFHLPPLPRTKKSSQRSGSSNSSDVAPSGRNFHPQTLEELLERQWEQGSQFLMDQASHFDIASLLSSLHQLKEENNDLEDNVDRLAHRRDHLLAVRARLMALTPANILTPHNTAQSTPERPSQHTNGPSPANNRSSTHSSPRNTAATVSPIRVERTSAAMIISPRNLNSATIMSPRERHIPPPPGAAQNQQPGSHSMHQAPSPRDRNMPDRTSLMHMENGTEFHPPTSQQHLSHLNSGPPFNSSPSLIVQNRSQVHSSSSGGNLLTVVSSANSQGPMNPAMSHHRSMHHLGAPQVAHGPSHSPHLQTPPPHSSSPQILPPPNRQSVYPNSSMAGGIPPPQSSHVSRSGMHMGHPGLGIPPPPPPPGAGGIMGPPMSHPDLRQPYPNPYHTMAGVPQGPPHMPPNHGHPRTGANMMGMAHMRTPNLMDKR